jgi:hypothetical protein
MHSNDDRHINLPIESTREVLLSWNAISYDVYVLLLSLMHISELWIYQVRAESVFRRISWGHASSGEMGVK